MPSSRTLPLSLGLISFSALLFEILLTRLFSVVLLYHFAYVAVSLALLGFSIGALIVHYGHKLRDASRVSHTVIVSTTLYGIATLACALFLLHHRPEGVDLYAGMTVPTFQYVAIAYVAATVPFILAGICVSAILAAGREEIGRFYAYDLLGAAMGSLAVIPVLDLFGAPAGMLVAAVVGVLSGTLQTGNAAARLRWLPWTGIGVLALTAVVSVNEPLLTLRYSKGKVEEDVLFEKWNSFSRVTAKQGRDGLRVQIDAGAATKIYDVAQHPALTRFISTPAMRLRKGGDILVIGPGGGKDIAAAAQLGMRQVKGVELNPIVAELATVKYRRMAGGLYDREGVEIIVDEGRSYLNRTDERFDVVMLTNIDTWAATASGSFSLAENSLYTVEAFDTYLSRLKDDGILAITRWYFGDDPRETLRVMGLAFAALNKLGVEDPAQHCIVIQENIERSHGNLMLKKTPFDDGEIELVRAFLEKNPPGELVYAPGDARHPVFGALAARASDPQLFYDGYAYDVSPPTDDRPFFFYVIRAGDLLSSFQRDFYGLPDVTNIGVFLLVSSFVLNGAFMLLVIAIPLLFRRRSGGIGLQGLAPVLLYFACLGGGFMIVELVLMQRFILFLGHPALALTVVLFVILLMGGLGSRYSGRFTPELTRKRLPLWIGGLVVLVVIYTLVLSSVFEWAIGFVRPVRIGLSVAGLAPVGFLLGTCFPSGVRLLGERGERLLPWIWAINGSTSVLGSAVAMLIAMNRGFSTALYVGLALYVVAALCVPRLASQGARAGG